MQEKKQEKSRIKQNILLYLQEKNTTPYEFYKKSGVTRGILQQNNGINEDNIARFLAYATDVNTDWLLTGSGKMLKSEEAAETDNKKKKEKEVVPEANCKCEGAPYYNVDFIGGFDLVLNDQSRNPDYYINFPPYNKEGVVWCNITGHSMEPELNNGDFIAMKEMYSPIEYLPAGEIYGIITDDYRTIKRIRMSEREGFVRLIPTNKSPEYAEQEIPVDMIRKVYAVLGSIHTLF